MTDLSQEDLDLMADLDAQGYRFIVPVPDQGICALYRMIFTTGLFVGLDRDGYSHRYCYESYGDAFHALMHWSGEGDPGGEGFIKRKG